MSVFVVAQFTRLFSLNVRGAMNCATTNESFLKLTLMVRFLTAPNTKKNEINQVNLI